MLTETRACEPSAGLINVQDSVPFAIEWGPGVSDTSLLALDVSSVQTALTTSPHNKPSQQTLCAGSEHVKMASKTSIANEVPRDSTADRGSHVPASLWARP
jgi:hypothetical protein